VGASCRTNSFNISKINEKFHTMIVKKK